MVTSDLAVRIQRSATAFALGARMGLRTILAPSPLHTASKLGPNLVTQSRVVFVLIPARKTAQDR